MSAKSNSEAPTNKGNMFKPFTSPKDIGKCYKDPHLKTRMKADDSDAVLMSDQKLGKGIRQTGSAK